MNKQEKADKIISYLDFGGKPDWIRADCNLPGVISFRVKGINESIQISTQSNITDAYRDVAFEVVEAGYDYGRCKKIIADKDKEIEEQVENRLKMGKAVSKFITQTEKQRIDNLTESEKLIEIYEKYDIKIISYEVNKN